MSTAIGSIGSAFSGAHGLSNILKAGVTGLGAVGDIIGMKKQNQAVNTALGYEKNPSTAASAINQLTQPLSQGLTQQVGNNVQGYLAERGLSGSPNITAEVLAQALAPYQQQSQQTASNTFGQLLNPLGAGFSKPVDWGSLLKLWMPTPVVPGGSGATPNFGGPGYPTTGPNPAVPNLAVTPPTIPNTLYAPPIDNTASYDTSSDSGGF